MTPLLDAWGQPIKTAEEIASEPCPQCGAGPDRRVASGGFGTDIYPVCIGRPGKECGYEFKEQTCPPVIS